MFVTKALLATRGGRPNLTGFSIRDLKASIGKVQNDPWARAEAWRYEGVFSTWNRWRNTLPGLGTASVLFAGYCVYEHYFMQDEHHHQDGHDEETHH